MSFLHSAGNSSHRTERSCKVALSPKYQTLGCSGHEVKRSVALSISRGVRSPPTHVPCFLELTFVLVTECFSATFYLLPPLLAMHELQISLPSPETYWSANHQQWRCLPPLQPSFPLCAVLARIAIKKSIPEDLDQVTHLILLLSASVQNTAAQDLKRAMMLPTCTASTVHDATIPGCQGDFLHIAHETLLQHGCSQPLPFGGTTNILNDFKIAARIIRILDFTPARLLYPFSGWQTAESGASKARLELETIMSQNVGRARQYAYDASQLYRYFRATRVLSHTDCLSLLVCMLYLLLYIELAIPLQTVAERQGGSPENPTVERLDEVVNPDELKDRPSLRQHHRPHIAGIGFLDAERSTVRLYKETARIFSNSASTSGLARSLSAIATSLALGNAPEFPEEQPPQSDAQ